MHVANYLDIHIVCIYIPFCFHLQQACLRSEITYKEHCFISFSPFTNHLKRGNIVDAIIIAIIHPPRDCTYHSKPDNNTIQETPKTCRVQRE